ncbi:PREDICTED: uncharacterized protein LOC104814218 [Tarenaya hassleriana]|uniref:uncharacterized protein LOC104814218 n=1 Tax=Tarenaya hassleriana TaxID=28532 RepID=UPI00053C925C|nr:PREDICTED: uncharacterized protein LOC104814218 [Tarenaya hassleriana]
MSSAKKSTKRRRPEQTIMKPKPKPSAELHDDLDLDVSSDLKGIMSALQQIREKAHEDGRKKKEETISSVASEVKSKIDELKSKLEKERQSFAKALTKSSKECENILKDETAKFQELYHKFCKDKDGHMQSLKETISKFEEDKERLYTRYEQLRKKEKAMISEQEDFCAKKIAQLEDSLKKKKQDDKTFSILRKTLGTFLDNPSDEEFSPDA